jgi:cytosine/adenosine deaminase-related metal-dependent hydrolase
MGHRKFTAEHLFTGSRLLKDQVLVTDENGRVDAIIPATDVGSDVQTLSGILAPGFINAHCHLELSHMKGAIEPHTGMIDFLLGVMGGRSLPEGTILQAIADAETAMFQNGIVAVGDICNTVHTLPQKTQQRIYYHNFIEATGFVEATARARFDAARDVWERFRQAGGPDAKNNSLVPHAPYSVSPALFGLITGLAGNDLLTLHNQESEDEEAFFRTGAGGFLRLYQALGLDISFYRPAGKSSLQTCLPRFHAGQTLLLVHNVMTSEADLQFIRDQQQLLPDCHFCLCPNANLYIGNGLPDIALLRRYEVPLVIGTDSLASNHQLSILAELETLRRHHPDIPLEELLQWATLNGAKALGIQHRFGSFEKGKTPGVLLLENDLSNVKRLL